MIKEIRHGGLAGCIFIVILIPYAVFAVLSCGVDHEADLDASQALLKEAREDIAANAEKFIVKYQAEALLSKLSILESQSDIRMALERARSIESPFYSSLALGGIAATELPSDRKASVKHYKEALKRAGEITHWTGTHATSLEFLFQLLPAYPEKEARDLLNASKATLDEWGEGYNDQKGEALFELSKAITAITPDKAESFLLEVALKNRNSWRSIEYLATFIARQSIERALTLSEEHYRAKIDWPKDRTFRYAVLIELAKTDFPRAFEGIKAMRELDNEISAVRLAEVLLAGNRKKEAKQVLEYIDSLDLVLDGTKTCLTRLRSRLEQRETTVSQVTAVTPGLIDNFLKDPYTTGWRFLTEGQQLVFRDSSQVREFVSKTFPLIEPTPDYLYPHHGSPRSTALGFLVICSASIGEIARALEIAKSIDIPELRISYLLDAYEDANPLPSIVTAWPIHFLRQRAITIREGKAWINQTGESRHSLRLVALLSNPDGETRAAAAAELRQLIAANPDAKTNDHGEEYWKRFFKSVTAGTKYSDFKKLLPDSAHALMDNHSGWSGTATWRLDHYWIVSISYRDPDEVCVRPKLRSQAMSVWVEPPSNFTGTWVTWYVNGQKSHEIEYKNGKPHGSSIAYYDNGQKCYQHHFRDGAESGPALGWHSDGSKAYTGTYTDGKRTGKWIFWNEDGSVDTVEHKN